MSMESEITINEFLEIAPKIKRAFNNATQNTALEFWGNIMDFAPQDTGRLAGSWELEQEGENLFVVGTPVEYAAVQNYGSDPYVIYPRQAQALRFEINGQVIYAKEVLHPGINPTYYIEGAIAATESRIEEFVEDALDREGLT